MSSVEQFNEDNVALIPEILEDIREGKRMSNWLQGVISRWAPDNNGTHVPLTDDPGKPDGVPFQHTAVESPIIYQHNPPYPEVLREMLRNNILHVLSSRIVGSTLEVPVRHESPDEASLLLDGFFPYQLDWTQEKRYSMQHGAAPSDAPVDPLVLDEYRWVPNPEHENAPWRDVCFIKEGWLTAYHPKPLGKKSVEEDPDDYVGDWKWVSPLTETDPDDRTKIIATHFDQGIFRGVLMGAFYVSEDSIRRYRVPNNPNKHTNEY